MDPHNNMDVESQMPQSSQWTRHPENSSWTDSRDMVLLLERKMLFKVDFGRLEKYAVTIREIFGLPAELANEGTETNPVIIDGLKIKEFSSFLKWFDDLKWRRSQDTADEPFLLGVLGVCHKWMIDDGKAWAVAQLNLLSSRPPDPNNPNRPTDQSLSAARRLDMAERLEIPEFVYPAVSSLLNKNENGKFTRSITDDEINLMGTKTYSILAILCQSHPACIISWKSIWSTVILKHLIGQNPLPITGMAETIRATSFPNLNADCLSDTIAKLKQDNFFKAEKVITEGASEKVLQAYRLKMDEE
ncbi:hypothetical protein GALMADRAFT_147338 [Galerina marginata CBS 339.88]|uniref:BTB domain-containing protein n=1 Tax=Galerina marginata (strain CBS 339.88) TaxID=685588 RepID=A0A067SHB7_GALM3|nr:hypothetical protein GALMADRAFT_147338 [Galerina marginata CBS 339.88]